MIVVAWIVLVVLLSACTGCLVWGIASRNMPALAKPSTILTFHRIEKGLVLGSTWMPVGRFQRYMQKLGQAGYTCVSLEKRLSAPVQEEFVVSFDDALACLWEHAVPVLLECGYTATFFVVSEFVGKVSEWDVYRQPHMSRQQLAELVQMGFTIGSHTATHPDLTRLSRVQVVDELKRSKHKLEDMLGKPIPYLSYPFGRFNRMVQEAAAETGYKAALTINHPFASSDLAQYAVPANAVYFIDSFHNVEAKVTGGKGYWLEEFKSKIMNRFALGTSLVVSHEKYARTQKVGK